MCVYLISTSIWIFKWISRLLGFMLKIKHFLGKYFCFLGLNRIIFFWINLPTKAWLSPEYLSSKDYFGNTEFFVSFSSLKSICNYFLTNVKRYPGIRTDSNPRISFPICQKIIKFPIIISMIQFLREILSFEINFPYL